MSQFRITKTRPDGMVEIEVTIGGQTMRVAATKKDAEQVIKQMADAHNDLHAYYTSNDLASGNQDAGEDETAKGGSAQTVKQARAAALRVGTVASPTPCDLADAIRDHYAARDLRAANGTKKTSTREDAIRAAMSVDAPTK